MNTGKSNTDKSDRNYYFMSHDTKAYFTCLIILLGISSVDGKIYQIPSCCEFTKSVLIYTMCFPLV